MLRPKAARDGYGLRARRHGFSVARFIEAHLKWGWKWGLRRGLGERGNVGCLVGHLEMGEEGQQVHGWLRWVGFSGYGLLVPIRVGQRMCEA